MLVVEILIVLVLVVLNGLLALSELAVVSSRRSRLRTLADRGTAGAATALALHNDPGRFLSTVQVGITLIGIASGAFSGATLGVRAGARLASLGVPYAEQIGIGLVVLIITYLSVIVGELVPKQLALREPERFAVRVAPAMKAISKIAAPLVYVFDLSGRLALRLLGSRSGRGGSITDEEIHTLIAEAGRAGVIEPEEQSMIAGVMRLGDRRVRAVMTPRRSVEMIDLDKDPQTILKALRKSRHSRVIAYRGARKKVIGVLHAKDLLGAYLAGETVDPRDFVKPAPIVPDTIEALEVLDVLKKASTHVALVHDEYGDFEGIVTASDILEAIVGSFRAETGTSGKAVRRKDGGWLLEGDMAADEMADLLGVRLPKERRYHTVAGFVLAALGRIPQTGDHAVAQNWRLEVVDMDGRRIDKVLAERVPPRRARKAGKQ
jgi:magnesium and cobalt exporter, CNNM family